MTTDARNARIHAVLDMLETASTPGAVLDALPDRWQRFMAGPDEHGFHFSMRPDDCPGILSRIYDRGLAMGRGATQMEAISAAIEWIRLRLPRTSESPEAPEPQVPSYLAMLPTADLETARRRLRLISQGVAIADAYEYHVDTDLPVDELFRSHLSLVLAVTTEEDVSAQCLGDLMNVAHGAAVEDVYGPDGTQDFRGHVGSLLNVVPPHLRPQWLCAIETDGAITRIIGVFETRNGATLAGTALLGRQAQTLPEHREHSESWFAEWYRCLDDQGFVEYHPSNGMVDPRQKLRIMPF